MLSDCFIIDVNFLMSFLGTRFLTNSINLAQSLKIYQETIGVIIRSPKTFIKAIPDFIALCKILIITKIIFSLSLISKLHNF